MTEKELIANITKENYELKEQNKYYKETLYYILNSFYSIGGPLNDNVLRFDNKQLKYLDRIAKNIKFGLPRRCDCE